MYHVHEWGGGHSGSYCICRCQKYGSRVTVKLSVTRSGNRVEFNYMGDYNLNRFKNKLREGVILSEIFYHRALYMFYHSHDRRKWKFGEMIVTLKVVSVFIVS